MEKRIKILYLEDSIKDFELMHSIIESGEIEHKYFLTDNEKDFVNILNTENIDVILSDYNLPDYSGNEALKVSKENYSSIPFIFVSGTIGEDAAINAMLNGATDYVLKNKLERLVPAIKRAVSEKEQLIKQKKIEKSFHDSEKKFQVIMENSADAIFIINQQGKQVYSNKAICDMLGYTSDEMKSKTIADISPPNKLEEYSKIFKQILNGVKIFTEIELLKKDGNYISTDLNAVILPDGTIYGSYRDITKRKQAESELIKVNLEKEKHAEELITTNKELKQSIQLNSDKNRFISILSHDLKSPFNALLGFSEFLIEGIRKLNTDEIENIVIMINTSAKSSFDLLENILSWSRTQQGKIPFDPQMVSFMDICIDAVEVLKPIAKAKNIKIDYSTSDHIYIYADINMVKTVLRNLVSNAIKFTNNNGSISITAKLMDSKMQISVSDNGLGIPPDNLSKLFDISEVLTTKGTAGETGTGLGLLLCKEFVEKHVGKIWAESEVGKGSEFKFTLPLSAETI